MHFFSEPVNRFGDDSSIRKNRLYLKRRYRHDPSSQSQSNETVEPVTAAIVHNHSPGHKGRHLGSNHCSELAAPIACSYEPGGRDREEEEA